MKDKNIFIDFTKKGFNYYNNDIFNDVVESYLAINPEIDLKKLITTTNLTKVFLEVLAGNLAHVKNRNLMYHTIEGIYDYWRDYKRYLLADLSKSYAINEENYLKIYEDFNDYVLKSYRAICANLLNKKFTIIRELPAGGNAFILLNKPKKYPYPILEGIRYIHNVAFRPPFVVYSKSNKRKGIFPIINENPIDTFTKEGNWYAYPILVGNSRVIVYFREEYFSLAMALSNLFAHNDDYQDEKPDMIVLFGSNTCDGVYYDADKDIYVASLLHRDEIDYFGYMKKIILTVHNIKMIKEKALPIHGAGVSLVLKNHQRKNIILIGDSGAGKSETLEALRKISDDYIIDMQTVFDDMGTLVLSHNTLKAYGTEIGAFVRTDDLENGYAYRVFDRAIFMNPNQSNARLVLPVAIHDDIVRGVRPDIILYANNYADSSTKIKLFSNKEEALEVFTKGRRMAKGTTSENGLVETFFANPFGPVQLKNETTILLDEYFDYFFKNNIMVGEIYTGLGLPNGSMNPVKAAIELLAKLKGEN